MYFAKGVPLRSGYYACIWERIHAPIFPLLFVLITAFLCSVVDLSILLNRWPTSFKNLPNFTFTELTLNFFASTAILTITILFQHYVAKAALSTYTENSTAELVTRKVIFFSSALLPVTITSLWILIQTSPNTDWYRPPVELVTIFVLLLVWECLN